MNKHEPLKSGDSGEVRYVTIEGVPDLDDFSSGSAAISDGVTSATLGVTVSDSANRIIAVEFGTDPADWLPSGPAAGLWEIEYNLVLVNPARDLRWPNEGYDTIRVYSPVSATRTVYCQNSDILTGDVTVVDDVVQLHVEQAAEEIDAAIGHLYATPIVNPTGHTASMLKMINVKLATGRYFAAMSRGNEESENFYAKTLIKEGLDALQRIASGQVILGGVPTVAPEAADDSRAPTLINVDTQSGVGAFYSFVQGPVYPAPGVPITEFYDG